MMILSKERLLKEQKETGYRQEIIEKVVWLIQILNAIAEDSFLKSRLVLKGGTALNLFYFDLPRLSVDADLNYIGAVDRATMLAERPQITARLQHLFERMGLNLIRNPQVHAGGKMIWHYPSALGNKGNIEVDLNYMYRVPLLPVCSKDSVKLANQKVTQMLLLDLAELAAGKLAALIDRGAGRDFFDAYNLFQCPELNKTDLRFCFVIYAAMSRKKNFNDLKIENIFVDAKDLKNKLIPVLKREFSSRFNSTERWTEHLVSKVRKGFGWLLPFSEKEQLFIKLICEGGEIRPDLITNNLELADKIKQHPALLWSASKA